MVAFHARPGGGSGICTAVDQRTHRARFGGRLAVVSAGNLESRVSALETQVGQLSARVRAGEHDAAAARILAGAADRDVAEFRGAMRDFRQATTASFNALREDLTDLRTHVDIRLDRVDIRLDGIDARLDRVDTRFDRVDTRFDRVDTRFDHVDGEFAEIRGRLDAAATGQRRILGLLERLASDQETPGS